MRKRFIVAMAIAILSVNIFAQTSNKQQQIIDAVMKVYADELAKNPDDYAVLYSRANQYFMMQEYMKALQDVNAALKVTTRDDKETLTDEYVLRAKINDVIGNNKEKLSDLKEAYKLTPQSATIKYQLANAYYENDDYETSQKLFMEMYRANRIDYAVMAGLAKIEVKNRNYGRAMEYVDQAVKLYPAESEVFINRADVLLMMEQYDDAAQDLISALSVSGDTKEALVRLTKMADTNYDAVIKALESSISKAPEVGMFYYIRSAIAIDHNHYADALSDLETIIKNKLYDYHGIYHDAAVCSYHLNKQDDALKYVQLAIVSNPDMLGYNITKSKILMAQGRLSEAQDAVKTVLAEYPYNEEALHQSALLYILDERPKVALEQLDRAISNNPQNVENLLLRAWLQKVKMKKSTMAERDFSAVLTLGNNVSTWRGLALQGLNRDEDAAKWCSKIIADGILPGGECYYVAAVVMAQCGENVKALDYLDSALSNGYGSYYNIMVEKSDGYMTLEPIRSLPQFKSLVERHKSVFESKK